MTDAGLAVPPHRATILVGYGAFGLEVLRRLLASTAPRGVLTWEEPRGGAAPSERHLQDLALLWVPDPTAPTVEHVDQENAREGSALEMMRDLYRQIQQIGEDAPADISFADALAAAADTLLSAAGRAGRTGALPLGLDVIVMARPTSREVVGTLDRLLLRGMERLANNANLDRAVQGADALSFISILDFENYWDRADEGRSVRRAVHDSIAQWQKHRDAGRPFFGRFYLVDGRTDDGFREPFHRIDEISLLLEFLLFEGQRAGDLPRLYHSVGANESPVATFGIRLVERSAGLLAHLAAARFGIDWLDYLADVGSARSGVEPSHVRQRLAPYAPKALDEMLDVDSFRAIVDEFLSALETDLVALQVEAEDWPERVRARYEETLLRLEIRITAKARALMAGIGVRCLATLPDELRAGIQADLHSEREPVPIGEVISELETWVERLEQIPEVAPPPAGEAEKLLGGIDELHHKYEHFHEERVDVEGLRRWWPLLAIALAAGLTPVVVELLGDIPQPDPMRYLLDRAYAVLQWINNPLGVGIALFLLAWGLGAALHGSIAARVRRARRYYSDPDLGRFVDRLRSGLRRGGALRAPVDYVVDRILYDTALRIRGDVTREIGRVLGRLRERRREIFWLRDQLRGFLRIHGFTGAELQPDSGRLDRDGTGIRYAMERGEDFQAMLRSNPPGLERFRSTQTSEVPFRGWDERHSRAFLLPIDFLDRLSRIYRDPFEQELAQPGTGPQQQRLAGELLTFLGGRGQFGLAFRFKAQEGVPPAQRYCLLPALWRRLDGVSAALLDLGISDKAVFTGPDAGRGYLVLLQAGIETKCLLEQQ